jgi:polyisoprenoid-binding protein YceI
VRNRILLTTLALFLGLTLTAQTNYKLKDSKMTIAGTSTLHDWVSDVMEMTASGSFVVNNQEIEEIKNLKVSIKVKSIESSKGSIMNNKTYNALEEETHPYISFTLRNVNSMETTYFGQQIQATGNLTIAGNTQTVNLEVKGKVQPNGDLTFEGSKELNMEDFGIDPPRAMLGTLKTGELVTIEYSITLSKS